MRMACNHCAKAVHGCICKNEAKEGFGCSSSVPGGMFMRTSVADDVNRATLVAQYGSVSYDDGFNKEYRKSQSLRNHSHGLLLNADPASNFNARLFPSGPHRFPEVPTKVGFLSSNMNSAKDTPSFEFFVMSEEGINLYVDLNSSPSEWITTLKDEVFIDQSSNVGPLSDCSRCVSDASQHTNPLPYKNIQMNLHINKVEENSGCTNSSLSSVVSANCQDEVCPLEAKVASSGSYILTSNSNPAGISGCLERNQAVSSPCTASFQEKNSILENNVDVSVRTLQSNVSVHDVLSKSNREAAVHADVTNSTEMIECQRLKLRNTGYDNTDNSALSNCEENNLRKSESLGNTKHANVSVTKSDIDIDVMNLERDCRYHTKEGSSHREPSSSCQFCGQSNLNTEENLCCHQPCNHGNSAGQDPASASDENLIKGLLMEEKSGCMAVLNALNKVSKRPCSPEFKDTNQNKRLNYGSGKVNETQQSSKVLVKETVDDPVVLPRRSSRLHSK